ncbi:MAG: Cys/Met metabolism PLP-dependent enzyme [Bryobacterales bacterium]|jgi:hypothetical protein|nr:Cys/Met metabolism PLP-dependent enzyme [Bryobacterales bacterium]
MGIGEDVIRISVGIEDVTDLIADLAHALRSIEQLPNQALNGFTGSMNIQQTPPTA